MKKSASLLLACAITFGAFVGSAQAASQLDKTVDELLGINYKYAGTTTDGFDCSGFTSYVFDKFGIDLPRRSADQADVGTKVGKDELQPGDLVFFNTNGRDISHVGIYMGDGLMAHASTSQGVTIGSMDDSYYSKRYVTARRILNQDQFVKIAADVPEQAAVEATVAEAAPLPPETAALNADIASITEAMELSAENAGEPADPDEIVIALQTSQESPDSR